MQTLSSAAFDNLKKNAVVIEHDLHGDKVLLLEDNTYLKLFRRKRWFSSALIFPYCSRFIRNAKKLQHRNIATVSILNHYKIPAIVRTAVHYAPLEGETLRNINKTKALEAPEIKQLAEFIANLHNDGIFFRSLHLGNIVLTPNNILGLIDIADISFHTKGLSNNARKRNFSQFSRYPDSKAIMDNPVFTDTYLLSCTKNITRSIF